MGAAASDYFTSYADVQYGYLDAELAIENLHTLAAQGDFHRVSIRMKKGMDPNGRVFFDDDAYKREDTVMICAARGDVRRKGRKRHVKTLEVLRRFGGDVNLYNTLEQTALYVACERDLFRVAKWLIDHGADVNKCSKAGVSPLLCAYRNANAELVALLLDRGARAIDPPKSFSALQFPTVAKAARGEDNNEDEESESDEDDEYEEVEFTSPGLRPKTSQERAAAMERINADLERHMQQQQATRDALLQARDEARRIEEQRVYRERLADDNAKRKEKRRRQRAKANYDKYIARIEEKRREHSFDSERSHTSLSNIRSLPTLVNERRPHTTMNEGVSRLQWHQAPQRGQERPRWVPQEIATTQHSSKKSASSSDEIMLCDCQQIYDTFQQAATCREQLRASFNIPAQASSAGLPRLNRRNSSSRPETAP